MLQGRAKGLGNSLALALSVYLLAHSSPQADQNIHHEQLPLLQSGQGAGDWHAECHARDASRGRARSSVRETWVTTFMSLSPAYCTVTFMHPNPFGTPSMGLKQPTTRCEGQFPVWQTGPEVHAKDVVQRTHIDVRSPSRCIRCRDQVFHALVP